MIRLTPETRPNGRVARAKRGHARNPPKKTEPKPNAPRRGRDALSIYFREIASGEELLDRKSELAFGRLIQHALVSAARHLQALLTSDLRFLDGDIRSEATEEEIEAFRSVANARMRELNSERLRGKALRAHIKELLASEEGLDLLKRYGPPAGGRLADLFIEANLRLVPTLARRYWRPEGGMSLNELNQEGNIGLITSVLRFDPTRGLRFSTFASWWIRHCIGRAISDKGREMRIPVHLHEFMQLANKTRLGLIAKLGYEPSTEEVGAELARLAKENDRKPNKKSLDTLTDELTRKLYKLQEQVRIPVSIHAPVGHENDSQELGEPIPADTTHPWDAMVGERRIALMRRELLMAPLSPIERDIITRRFGFDGRDEEQTFQEIGTIYNLSRERIRQLQSSALSKLKKRIGRKLGVAA